VSRGPRLDVSADIRYALRMFARSPGWTAVAIISLTLGIAANLLVFSIVDAVLLRPFPYRDPSRLVFLWGTKSDEVRRGISGPDLEDWRRANRSFTDLDAFLEQWTFSIGDTGEAVTGACIGPSVLPILGVTPARGRSFLPADSNGAGQPVAIVSDTFWRTRMAAAPSAVGSTIRLNGRVHEVIGITEAGFFFPDTNAHVFVPIPCGDSNYADRGRPFVHAIGRLRDNVSIAQAEQDLDAINVRLARTYPTTDRHVSAGLQPLRNIVIGKYERALWILLGAVGLVLLIACANVAHLQLARGVDRQVELAIRAATGADRRRLFQQLVAESLVLASIAGSSAVVAAWVGLRAIRSLALTDIARIDTAQLDVRLIAVAATLSLLTTLIFGIWPAWKAAGVQVGDVLKMGGGNIKTGKRQMRELLATTELALATVLLIVAGLLIGSFVRLGRAQWGFDPNRLLLISMITPPDAAASRDARAEWTETVRSRIRTMPGVESVASADGVPIRYSWKPSKVRVDGRIASAAGWTVSHGYFSTIGTPILQGREFEKRDTSAAEPVVIVSRALANRLWPGQAAIGRRFELLTLRMQNGKLASDIEARLRRRDRSIETDPNAFEVAGGVSWRVVGVVEDIRAFGLNLVPEPAYYLDYRQTPRGWDLLRGQNLVVRLRKDAGSFADDLKAAIAGVNPRVQLRSIESMSELVAHSIGGHGSARLMMLVSTLFGSIALLLTGTGIFGIVLHTVNQRLPEIGVRIALGANRRDISGLLLRYGIRIMVGGIALGLTLTWAVSRSLRALVFEVPPTDPGPWAAAVGVLVCAVLVACAVPIRRAIAYDPVRLLRT